jgi:hypothetical protein
MYLETGERINRKQAWKNYDNLLRSNFWLLLFLVMGIGTYVE